MARLNKKSLMHRLSTRAALLDKHSGAAKRPSGSQIPLKEGRLGHPPANPALNQCIQGAQCPCKRKSEESVTC